MRYPVPNNWHLDDQDRQAARESGGWHALVFTKMARVRLRSTTQFLLLAQTEERGPQDTHYRFLDKSEARCPCIPPGRTGCGDGDS